MLRVGLLLGYGLGLVCMAGCAQWKSLSLPFQAPPPAYKTQYGLTPAQKEAWLKDLSNNASTYTVDQQAQLARELLSSFKSTSNPLLRREMVLAMGSLGATDATIGLHAAAEDQVKSVRVASCEAWSRRRSPEAAAALAGLLQNDADVDVRIAAAKGLANMNTPVAAQELVKVVDDHDPALQFAAYDALRSVTGQDLGNDPEAWKSLLIPQDGAPPVKNGMQIETMLAAPSDGSLLR